jgi:uncharacterized protein
VPWLLLAATLMFAFGPAVQSYFGAGQGIVLMTIVTLSGVEDPHEANAIKNAVATFVSLIAVVILAFRGLILWNYGLLMVLGALIGGFAGGKLAKVLSKRVLRTFVLVVAVFLTVVYFWRTYVR